MFRRRTIYPFAGCALTAVSLSMALFSTTALAYGDNDKSIVYLNQNWTEQERNQFYYTPQGSLLIPYSWYLALEQPDNPRLFNAPKHIERMRYISADDYNQEYNPDGLPIGFAKEPMENGEPWLGYTCAACHTGQMRYKGKTIRIEGGPTLSNFSMFNERLVQALEATLQNERKFKRFAKRVLTSPDPVSEESLYQAVADQTTVLQQTLLRSTPDYEYGFGRVDALGIILNEVFGDDLQQPDNVQPPNGPVSYPHLWDTPRLDWVQWNGSVNNPIGRNTGEVLGTFGHVQLTGPVEQLGTTNTRARELLELERLITSLTAPLWPEDILGEIDRESAERGRMLYSEYRNGEPSCESCHALPDANGQYPMTPAEENLFGAQFIETTMTGLNELGTDPVAAMSFATRVAYTGELAPYLPAPYTGASQLPAPVLLSITVGMAVQNSISRLDPPLTAAESAEIIGYRIKAPGLPPYTPRNILAYKARHLNGIWATAPFLHNGSVPSLYELLLPAEQRSQTFYVGSWHFDPKEVGYRSYPSKRAFMFDVSLPGNSNAGHEYGTDLTEDERWDLVEFMKTL